MLTTAIARFKTPGLRDLGHSAPYLHTGRADTLEGVLGLYAQFSSFARAGTMRNPDPELKGMALTTNSAQRLARASTACRSTLTPGTVSSTSACSASLWEMPSRQGVKIMAVGAMREM